MSTIIDQDYIRCYIKEQFMTQGDKPDFTLIYPMIHWTILDTVLIHTRGNQAKASRMLGMNRGTFRTHYRAYRAWKEEQKKYRSNGHLSG